MPYDPIWDTPLKEPESKEDQYQRETDEEFLKTPIKGDDGFYYYLLPKDNNLYRGDNSMTMETKFMEKPTYFGTNKDEVEQYGMVFQIKTDRPYRLLAIDNSNLMQNVYNNASEDIQKILENNYGYKTGIRNSVSSADNNLSAYLCNTYQYDGYAINTMETDFGGNFHKEVMICNPSGLIVHEQITDESERKKLTEKAKDKTGNVNRKSKKSYGSSLKTPNIFNISSSIETPMVFNYDSPINSPNKLMYDSPPSSPIRTSRKLFGGRKSKRESKRKPKQKSVKKTKTKRKSRTYKK